jgi:ribosome maturation factor RimP
MDRPLFKLDQYGDYLGEVINVRLHLAVNNRRKFKGKLLEIEGENLVFKVDGETLTVTYPQIDKANVVPQF